jgi:branched-chain amino acid transport system permease protein
MHTLDVLLQQVVNGLALGMMYALLALGFTMVYGIIELINFAHFSVFMTGTFVGLVVLNLMGVTAVSASLQGPALVGTLIALFLATMVATGVLGVLIERICLRPVRHVSGTAPMITTIGVAFILINVMLLTWGPQAQRFPQLLPNWRWSVGGAEISFKQIVLFVVGLLLMFGLWHLVRRTTLGKAMRATAQDPEAARLMGINVDTTISLTFLIGGMLAGAAGLIYALYQTTIWYFQGFTAGLVAFTAAVMGGIGNIRGAVLGGFIIGCIQQMSDNRIGPEWTPAIVFGYLVMIMVLRPRGLLGEETREAG